MKRVPILVIGASVAGIALCVARPKDTLLLEPREQLGAEFIASLDLRRHDGGALLPEAEALRRACFENDLIDADGYMHPMPVASLLAQKCLAADVNIRMMSVVCDRQRIEGGWLATYFDAQGTHALLADQVVDTLDASGGEKRLCAMLAYDGGDVPVWRGDPRVTLSRGRYEREYALKLALAEETDWLEARALLHGLWAANRIPGWRLASISNVFARRFDAPVRGLSSDGAHRLVSASFADLLYAYEGGVQCASRI